MADDNSIVISINGDPKGFEKAVEQVQGIFKDLNKTVQKESSVSSAAVASFIGNFASTAALNAIGAVRDAIGAVFANIKGGIDDAIQADAAVNKFNIALANTGKFSSEASQGFQDFADKFERSTGIAEESVLSVASKIQAFGKLTPEELQKATEAAADLSAATGVDFETAGNLFAKASQGNVEALKKLGLQVEDTGNAQRDLQQLSRR
jgi:phage-related minor tail protein